VPRPARAAAFSVSPEATAERHPSETAFAADNIMPTLQQQIAAKFLRSLSARNVIEEEKIERLRMLLASGKKLKLEELVSLFAEPSGGDLEW
jgi:hypothetical protein